MAIARGDKEARLPIRGLNTEANPLSFPVDEGFAVDLLNMEVDYDPMRLRPRKGLENFSSSVRLAGDYINQRVNSTSFLWESVAGDPELDILVFQLGEFLYFCDVDGLDDISANLHTERYDLTGALSGTSVGTANNARNTRVVMENVKGNLLVTSRAIDPVLLQWDASGPSLSATILDLKIRDIQGIQDGLEIDERPASLSDDHKYNLYNQGWYQQRKIATGGAFVDPIAEFNTINSAYPSNSDIVYIGMVESSGDLIFDADWLKQQTFGSSPAPRGHYVVDAFNIDRDYILTNPGESGMTSGGSSTSGGGGGLEVGDGVNDPLSGLPV